MDDDREALGDDPAAAFKALRAEVAALRASLGDGDGRVAPNYAPTLGKMAASLAEIEAHPALQLTPEAFAYQVRQARDAAQQQASRDMSAAIQRVDAAGAGLERMAERQRTGREQVRQVAIMTAVGAVVGVIVWVIVGADRPSHAGELERAGTDGRRDSEARPSGGRRTDHAIG